MKYQVKQTTLLVLLCLLTAFVPRWAKAAEETANLDNDALFAGYVDRVFSAGGEAELLSLGEQAAREMLGADEKMFYDQAVPVIKAIASGQQASASVSVYGGFSTAGNAFDDSALITALMMDYPYEMYWFDKTAGWSYSYGTDSSTGILTDLTLHLSVAEAYQGADQFTADTTKTGAATAAAANAAAIVSKYASLDDYEKLVAYRDEICALVSYNYAAADDNTTPYGDPWQLIYVFDGDSTTNVVCEGYSKAFQYLCDTSQWQSIVSCYHYRLHGCRQRAGWSHVEHCHHAQRQELPGGRDQQ